MWAKAKPYLNNMWTYLIGAIVILFGLFKYEQAARISADSKLETADEKRTDATLAQQQSDIQTEVEQVKTKAEQDGQHQLTADEAQEVLEKL